MLRLLAASLLLLSPGTALAEGFGPKLGEGKEPPPAPQSSMGALIAQGFEIRAAVANGGKIVVFLQKDRLAYACEMQSLTASRCGVPN